MMLTTNNKIMVFYNSSYSSDLFFHRTLFYTRNISHESNIVCGAIDKTHYTPLICL